MVKNRPNSSPFRVGILLIDDFALMSFASVVEPLRASNLLAHSLGEDDVYSLRYIPARGLVATSSSGTRVDASSNGLRDMDFDLLLVVAGGDPIKFQNKQVFNWLRRLARLGVRLGGVSGGPVILATAGLMQGRRMTVHWEHAEALQERSPDLIIERSLYVIDRDRVTCAGGIAPLDLMHALIAEHHGPAFARKVSDWFMHTDIRPSGGPQRAGLVERFGTTNRAVIDAIEAMENRLADPLTLDELARFAGVSKRQLNRLFVEKLGQSTMTFYRHLRLDKARNLLMNSTLPMTDIALATGFSSSAHFSKAHTDRFGMPPSAVRA